MIGFLGSILLSGVTVTLPAEARVRGNELLLGSIAQVSGDDPAQVARIRAVTLGYAPAPGYSRVLHPVRIEQTVRGQVRDFPIEFVSSGAVRVWPETEMVPAASIQAAARAALEGRLVALEASEVSAQPVDTIADLEVPAGASPYQLDAVLPGGDVMAGTLRVGVRVLIDGNLYRTVATTWRVEVWEERPVLTHALARGELVEASMLRTKRVSLSSPGQVPLTLLKVVGTQARRDLSAGQTLTELDVERPVLVNRGDTLFLQIRKGSISVRVVSVAQQSGAMGDAIQVEVADSGRRLSGTVMSKKLVEIDLSRNE
jgi:flagella basal body P-ring formation protein FlgA